MGAKSEALAKQFEAKAQKAVAVLEQLSAADWNKVNHEASADGSRDTWPRSRPTPVTPRG